MTMNRLNPFAIITTLPVAAISGGAAAATTTDAPAADHVSTAPMLTAAEAEAETARIIERLSTIQSPGQSLAQSPTQSQEVPPIAQQEKLPINLILSIGKLKLLYLV